MKFTYEVNLICSGADNRVPGCEVLACSDPENTAREAESGVLNWARECGWLQIGEDVWCPACAQARNDIEAIERNRAGRWVPRHGMRVVYRRLEDVAVPIGHRQGAGEYLKEGAVYTITGFHWADTQLMISVEGKPGKFFNVELFEVAEGQGAGDRVQGAGLEDKS